METLKPRTGRCPGPRSQRRGQRRQARQLRFCPLHRVELGGVPCPSHNSRQHLALSQLLAIFPLLAKERPNLEKHFIRIYSSQIFEDMPGSQISMDGEKQFWSLFYALESKEQP